MRNLKRVLSTIMAVAMMMSVVVFNTSAAFNDQDKIVNTEAVNMNVALGIINGLPDGSFNPTGNVTRAEMAKMICIALNGGKEPTLGTLSTPTFKDIKGHWAEAYIEYCSALGIVAGMGDGTFAPNANVTGTQAAKMLLVALGFDANKEGFNGANWSVNINVRASQKGLYTDLVINPNVALARDNAAQMIWNALAATMVEYEYSLTTVNGQLQNIQVLKDKKDGNVVVSLLADKFNAVEGEYGQMTGFDYNSDKDEWTYYFTKKVNGTWVANGTLGHNTFTSDVDYTNLYMQTVKVVYTEKTNGDVDEVFGIIPKDAKVLASGIINDLDEVKVGADEFKIGSKTYDMEDNDVYFYTYGSPAAKAGYSSGFYQASDIQELTDSVTADADINGVNFFPYNFVAIDNDDNGKVDFFVVNLFDVEQVDYVGTKNFTITNNSNTFKFEDVTTYNGFAEDDFVVYTDAKRTADDTATFAKVGTVLKGNVTATKGSYKAAVDGTWYNTISTVSTLSLVAGGTVKDAPVVNGFIFSADASGSKEVKDYAVVIATANESYSTTAKLLFSDGTKKVVETDVKYTTLEGKLVTFEVNSDNEYELAAAIINTTNGKEAVGSGFEAYYDGDFASSDLNSSSKVKYIMGTDIADDAVVFLQEVILYSRTFDGTVKYLLVGNSPTSTDETKYAAYDFTKAKAGNYYAVKETDFKVLTGATLKVTNGANMTVINSYADESSSTGYETTKLAYVANYSADNIKTTESKYAFVLENAVSAQNSDKDDIYTLELLTANGAITVNTKDRAGVNFDVVEGQVIDYTLNDSGEVDSINVLGRAGTTNAHTDAITAYASPYITLNSDTTTRYEITSDTVIIYIDAEDLVAGDSTGVRKAMKDASGNYINNVIVDLDTADDEVDLLVIDINNDIKDVQ